MKRERTLLIIPTDVSEDTKSKLSALLRKNRINVSMRLDMKCSGERAQRMCTDRDGRINLTLASKLTRAEHQFLLLIGVNAVEIVQTIKEEEIPEIIHCSEDYDAYCHESPAVTRNFF